jgi:hypothetical protein
MMRMHDPSRTSRQHEGSVPIWDELVIPDTAGGPEKDALAVEFGRRGGLKGGRARAEKLSPDERSEIARRAASARWHTEPDPPEGGREPSAVIAATSSSLRQAVAGRQFGTVLADPPWRFVNRTGKVAPEHKRLARYDTMSTAEIKALPVRDIAADKSHLYLWAPNALVRRTAGVTEEVLGSTSGTSRRLHCSESAEASGRTSLAAGKST